MKYTVILCLLTLCLFACKKETPAPNNTLIGEWQWVSSSGGIAGIEITPKTAGYNKTLTLSTNYSYKIYQDNSLKKSGTFTLNQAKSIYSAQIADFIVFDAIENLVIISNTNDELVLAENVYDGFSHSYKRKK